MVKVRLSDLTVEKIHDGSSYEVDYRGYLVVVCGSGRTATYAPGTWATVWDACPARDWKKEDTFIDAEFSYVEPVFWSISIEGIGKW